MRSILLMVLGLALGVPAAILADPPSPPEEERRPAEEAGAAEEPSAEAEDGDSEPASRYEERLEVRGRADDLVGIAGSAAEGATGREDLARRPVLRPGEIVETVPGVIATQHSGGGKANQYFLRGFNLDHGTDFRIEVEGMQVNLPTHGHGQGYADLSFLIPELLDTVRYRKGPYHADEGDFSSAGAIDIHYVDDLPAPLVQAAGGGFGYGRLLLADSFELGGESTLLAAFEASQYDGPWRRPDDYDKVNGLVRYRRGTAERGFSVTAMGYDGSWRSTDQLPRRAVAAGLVDRFGLLDPDLGGASSRTSLSAEWHRWRGAVRTEVAAYLMAYDLELTSNFTYFLDDPAEGDEFLQLDDRTAAGARFSQRRFGEWGGRGTELAWGLQARLDDVDNGLFESLGGEVRSVVRRDRVEQSLAGAWSEAEVRWNRWLRTRAGLRADRWQADVDSDLAVNSGRESDSLVSPKLSVVLGPWRSTELYANWGQGYHSNDARGATIRVDPRTGQAVDRVDPLVRARGADVGVRTSALPGLHTAVSAFVLELDSELVFVGDAGGTEASRPSRRTGIEISNHYHPTPWLSVELDATWADARFIDLDPAGREIPGAIEETYAAGVAVEDLGRWSGGLRWRYFGPRPLIEDGSVSSRSTSLVNARLGYRFGGGLDVVLGVFNLFDRDDSDIEYFYASRLPGEPAGGVEDVHFHPMEKRSARLVARWVF